MSALALQLELPHILVVANRVRTLQDEAPIRHYCQNHDLELVATIPFDEAIVAAEQHSHAPVDYAPDSSTAQAIGVLACIPHTRLAWERAFFTCENISWLILLVG